MRVTRRRFIEASLAGLTAFSFPPVLALSQRSPPDEITGMSAVALARAIRKRRLSSVEVVRAFLERIDAVNPALNAVVQLARNDALEAAARRFRVVPFVLPLPVNE